MINTQSRWCNGLGDMLKNALLYVEAQAVWCQRVIVTGVLAYVLILYGLPPAGGL